MVIREEEHVRTHREMTREAIALAMESRWQEASTVNRNILALSGDDLDASNRLGKSLLELGDVDGARTAFNRSLAIDPENVIARKNADRISGSPSAQAENAVGTRFAPNMFIGDSGKSAQVTLLACATNSAKLFISPGAPVELRAEQGTLAVFNQGDHYIGLVPPKLGRRLVGLIEEGNRYEGAISGSSGDTVKVVLHESYQHPSLRSKISFLSSSFGAESPSVGGAISSPAHIVSEAAEDEAPIDAVLEIRTIDEKIDVAEVAILDGAKMDDGLLPNVAGPEVIEEGEAKTA